MLCPLLHNFGSVHTKNMLRRNTGTAYAAHRHDEKTIPYTSASERQFVQHIQSMAVFLVTHRHSAEKFSHLLEALPKMRHYFCGSSLLFLYVLDHSLVLVHQGLQVHRPCHTSNTQATNDKLVHLQRITVVHIKQLEKRSGVANLQPDRRKNRLDILAIHDLLDLIERDLPRAVSIYFFEESVQCFNVFVASCFLLLFHQLTVHAGHQQSIVHKDSRHDVHHGHHHDEHEQHHAHAIHRRDTKQPVSHFPPTHSSRDAHPEGEQCHGQRIEEDSEGFCGGILPGGIVHMCYHSLKEEHGEEKHEEHQEHAGPQQRHHGLEDRECHETKIPEETREAE
mmetsp:Transcript_42266/g.111646  ORF Transcript_42266/g.111646 Transcript_42266/m.111646 type:complete len:337 (-) Transcript_42266:1070-2080(-)